MNIRHFADSLGGAILGLAFAVASIAAFGLLLIAAGGVK
jgi:hypothetical protein